MRLAGWLGVIAVLVLLLLPRAEGADDKRAVALEGEVKALRGKVAGLETRLKEIERAVQASGGGLKLVSAGAITIQAGGGVDIKGAVIKLNGGSKPVARAGDAVAVQGSTGQIAAGSPTVLSQ